mgnify:FL=1
MASQVLIDTNTKAKLIKALDKLNKKNSLNKYGNTAPMKEDALIKAAIDDYVAGMIKNKVIKWN